MVRSAFPRRHQSSKKAQHPPTTARTGATQQNRGAAHRQAKPWWIPSSMVRGK